MGGTVLDYKAKQIFAKGFEEGLEQVESKTMTLFQKLFEADRMEDAKRATEDPDYRKMLMKEFRLAKNLYAEIKGGNLKHE